MVVILWFDREPPRPRGGLCSASQGRTDADRQQQHNRRGTRRLACGRY